MRRGFFRLALVGCLLLCLPAFIKLGTAAYYFWQSGAEIREAESIGYEPFLFDRKADRGTAKFLSALGDGLLVDIKEDAAHYGIALPSGFARFASEPGVLSQRLPRTQVEQLAEASWRAKAQLSVFPPLAMGLLYLTLAGLWFAGIWTVGWIVRGFTERA